jgi:hypothetical protein
MIKAASGTVDTNIDQHIFEACNWRVSQYLEKSKKDLASFCRKRLGEIIDMFGMNLANYLREEISTLINYTEEIPGDAAYKILHEDDGL